MSSFIDDTQRRVIPRWRSFATTAALGELGPAGAGGRDGSDESFSEKLRRWRTDRNYGVASELVGSALVLGRRDHSEVRDAIDFVVERSAEGSIGQKVVARLAEGPQDVGAPVPISGDNNYHQNRIHAIRHGLSHEPRDAVLWTDLGREYTILGHLRQAVKVVENAIRLAPNNRFVLRAATRLFSHIDDPRRAHDLLRGAGNVKDDPWLLAAEIAAASVAERSSRLVKRGMTIARDESRAPHEITELASTVATLEMENGAARSARRLFRISLVRPTDNSLAQVLLWRRHVEWLRGEDVTKGALRVARPYEASAWREFYARKWVNVVGACREWMLDEPYSVRPAMFGSFVSLVVIGDSHAAEQLAECGLKANKKDARLYNNYAVALAEQGQVGRARDAMSLAWSYEEREDVRSTVLTATEGLLAFRRGDITAGRMLYRKAIRNAQRTDQTKAALAEAYLAREEALADLAVGDGVGMAALEVDQDTEPYVVEFISRIRGEAQGGHGSARGGGGTERDLVQ